MILALVARPHLDDADGTEFLRLLAAFVALERPVTVVEVGPGAGALTSPERSLTPDGEHYLTALLEEGIPVQSLTPDALADAIASASALLLLPDPDRPATPPVLVLARGHRPDLGVVKNLLSAGQVRLDDA